MKPKKKPIYTVKPDIFFKLYEVIRNNRTFVCECFTLANAKKIAKALNEMEERKSKEQ
jgi:hypothetical protein